MAVLTRQRSRRPWATVALTTLVAVVLTGCFSRDEADDMTPDEAYTKLQADLEAVVEAVAPGVEGMVLGSPQRDIPCGGIAGTDRSEVYSGISGALGKSDWDGDLASATERLQPLAEERGYEVRVQEKAAGGSTVTLVTPDAAAQEGFVISLNLTLQGALTLSGDTPCLANPND